MGERLRCITTSQGVAMQALHLVPRHLETGVMQGVAGDACHTALK